VPSRATAEARARGRRVHVQYVDWDRFDAEQGGEAEAVEHGGGEQGGEE